MRRFVAILFFLALANDASTLYGQYIFSPMQWVQPLIFNPLPIKIRPFDLIMALILAYASSKAISRGPRVRPMRTAMHIAAITTVVFFLFGVVTGGSAWAASWQIYLILATMLTSLVVAAINKTGEHFVPLAKAMIAASLYHATMGIIFFFTWVRPGRIDSPEYLTTHYDTIIWTLSVIALVVNAIEMPSRKARLALLFIAPYLLYAIQINNRRLAWVSLAAGLLTSYVLLRPSKTKRRINRSFLAMLPVLAIYIAVGWGREGKIFAPLRAFSTVSTSEDASTLARDAENLGLIATANHASGFWILGTGWGHGYTALTDKYSIAQYFDLWTYVPHNSILGLLAFTGCVGFAGYWLMFPTAVFLHARTARLAQRPIDRAAGIMGVATVVVCANQMYGDMGIFSPTTMYVAAVGFGIALRLPAELGVWPSRKKAGAPLPAPPVVRPARAA